MGGGASLMEGVEELVATTILIGRAISAMQFPGMYRIYDFHSKKAPRLTNNSAPSFNFFALQNGQDDEEDNYVEPDPSRYQHFFKVRVNGDDIYLEDPLEVNEAGWTALHTCCMSLGTVQAGLDLIEETKRLGGTFETITINGPGNFNKGWTPLQMACAYGIDALVDKLVQAGADVNATNSYGCSCLLEACHRGYAEIVKFLLRSPHIHVNYIASERDAMNSPFSSSPPQTSLGEASRCGYFKIVQMLIDAGANKEAKNMFGWTPLHEACFYHRLETVKTLLLAGADATARTNLGALPYHLAGLTEIRNMLESMGGAAAVPKDGDTIDMVKVLTELTTGSATLDEEEGDGDSGKGGYATMVMTPNGPMVMFSSSSNAATTRPAITNEVKHTPSDDSTRAIMNHSSHDHHDHESKAIEVAAVPSSSSSTSKVITKPKDTNYTDPTLSSLNKSPSKRADSKTKSQTPMKDVVPADMPKQYLCELTQKPMSEPMRTLYGNVYEKSAIVHWFKQQGHICPLTGAPLSETDLTLLPDLANEIRTWILKKSLAQNDTSSPSSSPVKNKSPDAKKQPKTPSSAAAVDEDLYDF